MATSATNPTKAAKVSKRPAPVDTHVDTHVRCKDCSASFLFTAAEQQTHEQRGFGPMVRCAECRSVKKARYAAAADVPSYDQATEAKLDAWVAAKRSKAFDAADRLRAALRADGVDTEAARPLGYDPDARSPAPKKVSKVKCFRCGQIGHRSESCTAKPAGSTACYHCGSEEHKGRDCPEAPEPTRFDPSSARCFGCGQMGHVAAACPALKAGGSKSACHVCGEEGHRSRYCPRARDRPLRAGVDRDDVEAKRQEWAAARERKDYTAADAIRAELLALGVNPNKPAKK